jgi:DNA processing protein
VRGARHSSVTYPSEVMDSFVSSGTGDEKLFAAAVASLGAGPGLLRRIFSGFSPTEAWQAIRRGEHPADPEGVLRPKATNALLESVHKACERVGASVVVLGSRRYPKALEDDREAPAVLFALGDPRFCDGLPRVAIVGTRSATPYGLGVAKELGRDLARAGVVVISGMASGVDSAAHGGALEGEGLTTLAVVGTTLDGQVSRHQQFLRSEIAERGAVISELAPGSHGAPTWWFAVRNRVIAALAHVVVVVECHVRGGALHTVKYAKQRVIPVGAVPGSVRSPASVGTNALLVDGATAVRDARDVLSVLEQALGADPTIPAPRWSSGPSASVKGSPPDPPSSEAARVLDALDHDPAPFDSIVIRSALSVGEVALALEQLAEAHLAESDGGWWSKNRR